MNGKSKTICDRISRGVAGRAEDISDVGPLQVQLAAKTKIRQAHDTLKGVLRKHHKQPGSGVQKFRLRKSFPSMYDPNFTNILE